MVCFPNAKINLGLNVIRKRNDGYHDLKTAFYPVPYQDILEIVESKEFSLTTSGISIPGQGENLVLKAYKLLKKEFRLPPVKIILHKYIPIGSGLAGGSSNGAFALITLNKLFELGIDEQKLIDYSLELGSDCPFFIKNKAVYAENRGEKFKELDISLKGYHIFIISPKIHVSTAEAFSGIQPGIPDMNIKEILEKKPINDWKDLLTNDFEGIIFRSHPVLGGLKKILYQKGAIYASLTGTGSSIYGIFKKPINAEDLDLPDYMIWLGTLE